MNALNASFRCLCVPAPWLLGAVLGFVCDTVQASTLYRCKDRNGVTAYTSSKSGYSQCSLVGRFQPERDAPRSAATAGTGGKPGTVEFRTAAGAAEPRPPATPASAVSGSRVTRGAVYRYVKNGVTHYTNRRPAGTHAQVLFTYIETCFACRVAAAVDFHSVALNLTAYADEIAAASARHGVDEALIRAVIHAESAFNPNAVSRAGAQGLMQLIPATAKRFGVEDPFAPGQNIEGGVEYLAWLGKRFSGDLSKITAGYNAGEGAVERHGGVPPYAETQVYVQRVGILRERYRKELLSRATPATTATVVPVVQPAPVVNTALP